MRLAASRTFWTAESSKPIRMAMIAMTTKSSISVNPRGACRESRTIVVPPLRGVDPLEVSRPFLPPRDVPDADLAVALVPGPRGHLFAVGAEGRAPDVTRVTSDQGRPVGPVRLQELDPVAAHDRQPVARAEECLGDALAIRYGRFLPLGGRLLGHVPRPGLWGRVDGRHQALAVGTEYRVPDDVLRRLQDPLGFLGVRLPVPDLDEVIPPPGRNEAF